MCELAKKLLCSDGGDRPKGQSSFGHSLSKLMTGENLLSEAIC